MSPLVGRHRALGGPVAQLGDLLGHHHRQRPRGAQLARDVARVGDLALPACAAYSAETTACSISAPEKPSLRAASAWQVGVATA